MNGRRYLLDTNAIVALLRGNSRLVRRTYRLKLPDAIIAATAIDRGAALVTADVEFQKVAELSVIGIS